MSAWRNVTILRDNGGNTEILWRQLGYEKMQMLMDMAMASGRGRVLALYHYV